MRHPPENVDEQGSNDRARRDDGPGSDPGFLSPDVEVCQKVIQACANGGAKCIEFTNRGDFASHVFFEGDAAFRQGRSDRDHGRRLDRRCPTAGIYIANGAKFVVGPSSTRRRQGLQSPLHSLLARLRLGQRDS
jgi:hypothetical protein